MVHNTVRTGSFGRDPVRVSSAGCMACHRSCSCYVHDVSRSGTDNGNKKGCMKMKKNLTECSREDGNTCLMWKDGGCNALRDTMNCTFYKDIRNMTDYEVIDYKEELYLDGYRGASKEEVEANINRWRAKKNDVR